MKKKTKQKEAETESSGRRGHGVGRKSDQHRARGEKREARGNIEEEEQGNGSVIHSLPFTLSRK